ncbi:hypothetical protein ACVMGC_001877 [Bradyrhizobium barranii subsp. barranii]
MTGGASAPVRPTHPSSALQSTGRQAAKSRRQSCAPRQTRCAAASIGPKSRTLTNRTGYQSPPGATVSAAGPGRLDPLALLAVIVAGLIWGLFNVGFAMIFSFGPSLLAERGWSIAAAGSAISLVMWLSVISVPAGGYLADRFKRPLTLATAASLIVAGLLAWLPRSDAVITSSS